MTDKRYLKALPPETTLPVTDNTNKPDQVFLPLTSYYDLSKPVLEIGRASELTPEQHICLKKQLEKLIPWRKGPFCLFGNMIKSEWRSDLKWKIIEQNCVSLSGKKILDVGCNNGYYMLRMLAHRPDLILGIDPVDACRAQFQLLRQALPENLPLFYEKWGHEHLNAFKKYFDIIFLMGIIYHTTDPISLLRRTHQALAPGGKVYLETQAIPGELPIALTPEKKYANAGGMWFIPTAACLHNWLRRSGFNRIKFFHEHKLISAEQQSSQYAPRSSLDQGLSADESRTKEGYPAPVRIYIHAQKN